MIRENPHEHHRSRLKKEFMNGKIDYSIAPHKMLELLLYFCVPRVDTNPLAHQLLDRYGNIANVLDAPVNELIRFKGLTESNVVLLKLIMPFARIYHADKQEIAAFRSREEIGRFICDQYAGITEEKLSFLCLDGFGQQLHFGFLSTGDLTSVSISTRSIVQYVLDKKAGYVIMAHNHPNASALPSTADIETTKRIAVALATVGVHLLDHVIVSNDDYVSLAQSREFCDIFNSDQS